MDPKLPIEKSSFLTSCKEFWGKGLLYLSKICREKLKSKETALMNFKKKLKLKSEKLKIINKKKEKNYKHM
jgi:hypothetical protein